MQYFPDSIKRLVEHFDALPGIGPKNAIKLALHVLSNKDSAHRFAVDLDNAIGAVTFCSQCQTVTDASLCSICDNAQRDHATICVVAHIQDIEPIERTGKYNGVYHVLHGALNPIEGITPDHIKMKELIGRIEHNGIKEIILALDATMDGEATVLYLTKQLKKYPLTISKLARGIPMGSNIEYTDEVTLSSALENRKTL